jgi:probable rRNA maturation factor
MIDLDNQTTLKCDLEALEKIASTLTSRDIELIITDDETMKSLNSEHRGKACSTDVLSFPLETVFTEQILFDIPLGSIVVSAPFIRQKADELGHSIQDELSLLFIHGLLHLLGFDHERDEGEMRLKEKELIEMFNLPKSLIIRTKES